MSRHIPEHPKKGSAEAYEWAERMRQARQKKARTKAAVREAGQLTEMQFFGPGGSLEVKRKTKRNPGAEWHKGEEDVAHRYRKQSKNASRKAFFAGVEAAHHTSASAAKKMGMNPRKRKREAFIENLIRQCAWCKKPMGETIPYSDTRITHGICEACLKKEMKAAQKITKNPHMLSSRWEVVRLKDGATQEMSYQSASKFYGKQGYDVRMIALQKPKKRMKKNPIAVYNPPTPKVVGTIYNKAIEIRAKKTGSDLAGKYKHVFGKNVKILGLDNGDVVIHHTGGKRLWISRKDYEHTGREHE